MKTNDLDVHFLRNKYSVARNKYKPRRIETLLIAEAPPDSLDRFFYFEDVKRQDSLFLEIMGVLYPDQKQRYLASGRDTAVKEELLESFKEDGFWLLDLSEVPLSISEKTLAECVPSLVERLEKFIDRKIPIVLIKASVYDLCYCLLHEQGFSVNAERLPFPGSGQQKVFREKFRNIVSR